MDANNPQNMGTPQFSGANLSPQPKPKSTKILFGLIGLLIVTGVFLALKYINNPTQTTQALSENLIKNNTYFDGTIKLVDGYYAGKDEAGKISADYYTKIDNIYQGDLDGDGNSDAVVILSSRSGGTGVGRDVAFVLNKDGQAKPVDAFAIVDDRPEIKSVKIENGIVLVTYAPWNGGNPVDKTIQLKLVGNVIEEITTNSTNNESLKTYSNAKYSFEVKIPSDWIVEESKTGDELFFFSSLSKKENDARTLRCKDSAVRESDPMECSNKNVDMYFVSKNIGDNGNKTEVINGITWTVSQGENSGWLYQIKKGDKYYYFKLPALPENKTKMVQFLSTFKFTDSSAQNLSSNMFSIDGLKVGQKVGAMTVSKLPSQFAQVEFTGTVKLVGRLSAPTGNPEDGGMGPEYSIHDLTTDSLKQLPYLKTDTRTVWFGIRNPEIIKNAGVKNGDRVAITISRYYYVYLEGGVWNNTDIVAIQKSK